MTYSPMGTAWMPLAVARVTPLRASSLSKSSSTPAAVSCTHRNLGARPTMSAGMTVEVNSTSASARMAARLALASSSVSSSGRRSSA